MFAYMTPYLALVIAGFAVFMAVLAVYSTQTLIEDAKARKKD